MDEVFGHPLSTYIVVLAISTAAGLVRLLNGTSGWKWSYVFRDCITSAFNGIVVFWFCDYKKIAGSLQLVIVAVAAMMGTRVWVEIENYLRMRYGSGSKSLTPELESTGSDPGNKSSDTQGQEEKK